MAVHSLALVAIRNIWKPVCRIETILDKYGHSMPLSFRVLWRKDGCRRPPQATTTLAVLFLPQLHHFFWFSCGKDPETSEILLCGLLRRMNRTQHPTRHSRPSPSRSSFGIRASDRTTQCVRYVLPGGQVPVVVPAPSAPEVALRPSQHRADPQKDRAPARLRVSVRRERFAVRVSVSSPALPEPDKRRRS